MSGKFEKYFYDIILDCPYELPFKAVYHQANFSFLPDEVMEYFLENGYRRNGNYIYQMACSNCQACIPIRLHPKTFQKNRNQKRAWQRNQDLEIRINPLRITNEKLAILDKFLESRFPGKDNSAIDYYAGFFVNNLDRTFEVEMWIGDHLVGVSIVDIFPESVNCVYFYFDPDFDKRSLGTFNILYLLDFALTKGLKNVYLGYLIREVAAMAYKEKFKPHYLLIDGQWQEVCR